MITPTVDAELRSNAARAIRPLRTPRFAGHVGIVPDVMDVNLRINIRAAIGGSSRGLFGDGAIGATALRRGIRLITNDQRFATAIRGLGGQVGTPK